MLKQVGTTKSLSMKEHVPSVNCGRNPSLTKLWEILLDKRYAPFQNWNKIWWYTKIITRKFDITVNYYHYDYYINLQLIVFISLCFAMRDKLIWFFLGILDNCHYILILPYQCYILSTLSSCIVIVMQIKLTIERKRDGAISAVADHGHMSRWTE